MKDPSLTLLNPAFSESLLPRELCPQPRVVRELVVYSHVQVTPLHRPQSPYTLTLVHILLVHQGGMSHQENILVIAIHKVYEHSGGVW